MTKAYSEIAVCRLSGSRNLTPVLNLGQQALTGIFPRTREEIVTEGPLELVWCADSGLLQLRHSYLPDEMYGDNYGYRSGLNQSMVAHLAQKAAFLERLAALKSGDVVLDIGSNDGTLLRSYSRIHLRKIGIDPTGAKFREYYPDDVLLVPEFFSVDAYRRVSSTQAKVVTSVAMFYDLENPVSFAQQVASVLASDGLWHFEQSYMPSMLRIEFI